MILVPDAHRHYDLQIDKQVTLLRVWARLIRRKIGRNAGVFDCFFELVGVIFGVRETRD